MSARRGVRLLDWAMLVVCNLIWASQFVLAKLVQQEMGPLFATLLPMAIATLCLVPLVHRESRSRRAAATAHTGRAVDSALPGEAGPRAARAADFVGFVLIGLFGQVAAQLGVTWGVRLAPASNAALLSLTLPIATAVIAYLLLGERMTRLRWASFALAVVGVMQCSGVDWSELRFSSSAVLAGNLLISAGILGSAFYNVYSKKLLDRYTPLEVMLYSYYVVLICLLPLTLYLEPGSFHRMLSFTPGVWLGVALLAGLQYLASMILFLSVLSRLDAAQAGLSNYLIPVFGVIIASVVLGERLTARMAIGGLAVLASTLLVTEHEQRAAARASG